MEPKIIVIGVIILVVCVLLYKKHNSEGYVNSSELENNVTQTQYGDEADAFKGSCKYPTVPLGILAVPQFRPEPYTTPYPENPYLVPTPINLTGSPLQKVVNVNNGFTGATTFYVPKPDVDHRWHRIGSLILEVLPKATSIEDGSVALESGNAVGPKTLELYSRVRPFSYTAEEYYAKAPNGGKIMMTNLNQKDNLKSGQSVSIKNIGTFKVMLNRV